MVKIGAPAASLWGMMKPMPSRHTASCRVPSLRAAGALLLVAATFGTPTGAQAQEMAQGEASITARNDVRLSIESGPGTSGGKLSQIGSAVGGALAAIRQCYRDVAQERPTVQGSLRLMVTIGGEGAVVDVQNDTTNDEPLATCAVAAVEGASFTGIRPPGSAYIGLDFSNSAAAGVARTRARREREDAVTVTANAEGRFEATGGTPGREIVFTVTGAEGVTGEAVASVQRLVRATIPSLLDCRRKAGRRGGDPAGVLTVDVRVNARGRGRVRVTRNTIQNRHGTRQAARCANRGLGGAAYTAAMSGRYTVSVQFAGEATPAAR